MIKAKVEAVYPTQYGHAVFIKCTKKTFVIYVDKFAGLAIHKAMKKEKGIRPLTHEFMADILAGTETQMKDVLIYSEKDGVFFAKVTLCMKNELGEKIIEIDARPSDSLSLALRVGAPIFVLQNVLDNVGDAKPLLLELKKHF